MLGFLLYIVRTVWTDLAEPNTHTHTQRCLKQTQLLWGRFQEGFVFPIWESKRGTPFCQWYSVNIPFTSPRRSRHHDPETPSYHIPQPHMPGEDPYLTTPPLKPGYMTTPAVQSPDSHVKRRGLGGPVAGAEGFRGGRERRRGVEGFHLNSCFVPVLPPTPFTSPAPSVSLSETAFASLVRFGQKLVSCEVREVRGLRLHWAGLLLPVWLWNITTVFLWFFSVGSTSNGDAARGHHWKGPPIYKVWDTPVPSNHYEPIILLLNLVI